MQEIANQLYSLDEYFEFDKNAEGNFEYFDGEIFEMSGVSPNHARIEMNLAEMLSPKAKKKGCRAFPSNLRVKIPMLPTYRYPDLTVSCGKVEFVEIGGLQCLVNPSLIVEVLSDSTERYDDNEKFRQYKSIESFVEYSLISSTEKVVVLYQKHNGRFWLRSDYVTGEPFHLNTLDFDINVDELYQGVEIAVEQ
jgi:Uma2 family endonuclease